MAVGLRDDSRIKLKKAGLKQPVDILLLASAVDRLSYILWSKTKDAKNGVNKPPSIFAQLTGQKQESNIKAFNSGTEFEKARQQLIGEVE